MKGKGINNILDSEIFLTFIVHLAMSIKYLQTFFMLSLVLFATSCKKKIKQQEDEVYSRHLQRQVKLTIITTPLPEDKSTLNLLLLNDGQDIDKFHIKDILDSLYNKKLIQPLVIVGITAGDRMHEYGVSGYPDFMNRGDKADKYAAFIDDELYPFAKRKRA